MRVRPIVVVRGGGFAELANAFYLRHKLSDRVDVSLVSDRDYFLFKPNMIYIPFGEDPEKFDISLGKPAQHKHIEFIRKRVRDIVPSLKRAREPRVELRLLGGCHGTCGAPWLNEEVFA